MALIAASVSSTANAQDWNRLVDRYFDEAVYPFNPSAATSAGFHQWDTALEDYSAAATVARQGRNSCGSSSGEVVAYPASQMDRDLILSNIHSTLLELDSIRMWQKNPDLYSSTASNAVFVIMSRKFAPADQRLEAAIAREKSMPNLFTAAHANLKNPPRVYTEVAIEQLTRHRLLSFREGRACRVFVRHEQRSATDRFHKSNADVIASLKAYETWLKTDLLPLCSKGDFQIRRR